MTDELLQCCYTNASKEIDGKISSGWQAVSVSSNIPPEAFAICTRLQNANSIIQSTRVDEDGKVLNLLEIIGDGSYIYMIRTQYGLLDRLGRANMFSHAFVLPCRKGSLVSDPNCFLTIANENFRYSEEESGRHYDKISRTEAMDLERAMERCGLTDELYLTLIQCVYVQYSNKSLAKPLYIQYDGTEEHLRNLLFCIYAGIPLSLRRTLSIASSVTDGKKSMNILFTRDAASKELFLVPATGENNVLSQRTLRKTSRLGFVGYAAQNHRSLNTAEYFCRLEESAAALGDSTASDELILKIAHSVLTEPDCTSLSDDELQTRLSDMLRSKSIGSKEMDDHIAQMLKTAVERRLTLTDENEASLTVRVNAQASASLSEAEEQYTFYRFTGLPPRDAAKRLVGMSGDVFRSYRKKLRRTEDGRSILNCYYRDRLDEIKPGDWGALNKVLKETEGIPELAQIDKQIEAMAGEFYQTAVLGDQSCGFRSIVTFFDNYISIMHQISDESQLNQAAAWAKNYFWSQMGFSSFSFDYTEEYRSMEDASKRADMFAVYAQLPQKLHSNDPLRNMSDCDCEFFGYASNFFLKVVSELSRDELEAARSKLVQQVLQDRLDTDELFEPWCRLLFSLRSKDCLSLLLDIYSACKRQDPLAVQKAYGDLTESTSTESKQTKREVAKLLISWYLSRDSAARPVELDVWLPLSRSEYRNAFGILDRHQLAVVEMDPALVAYKSKLLGKSVYTMDAEIYIRDKGEYARTVKKWISEHNKKSRQGRHLAHSKVPRIMTDWGQTFGKTGKEEKGKVEEIREEKLVKSEEGTKSEPLKSDESVEVEKGKGEEKSLFKGLFGRR